MPPQDKRGRPDNYPPVGRGLLLNLCDVAEFCRRAFLVLQMHMCVTRKVPFDAGMAVSKFIQRWLVGDFPASRNVNSSTKHVIWPQSAFS